MLGTMEGINMDESSLDHRAALTRCETIIERGLDTFSKVGNALLEIRDNRLYRDTYGTFEEYCEERWSISRFYAHRLIDAAQVAENLLPIGNKPTHESQVRPLSKLEPEAQRNVWAQAVQESNGHTPTASTVQKITNRFLEEELLERQKREQAQYERRKQKREEARARAQAEAEAQAEARAKARAEANRLNVPPMMQEKQYKDKEAELRHELSIQLIDIGYKVLATKLHPDKGGSPEAMLRLNAVREILKKAIAEEFQSWTSFLNFWGR